MHKTGETITVQFCVSDPATAGLVNADALPTGVLALNGANNAATVTITNLATGIYRAAVTLPTLTDGDELQLRIAATVGGVAGGGIVWHGYGVTKRPADVFAALPAALTAAAVWSYVTRTLTQTAAQVAAALAGSDLTIHRGDTFSATLTGLGSLPGRTALWFTVKRTPASEADSAAKIQIEETAGLTTLNGADYATPAHGSLSVNGGENAVTIAIHGIATAQLSVGQQWEYDLQVLDADGDPYTIAEGQLTVDADVTRALTDPESSSSPGP